MIVLINAVYAQFRGSEKEIWGRDENLLIEVLPLLCFEGVNGPNNTAIICLVNFIFDAADILMNYSSSDQVCSELKVLDKF